jgi:nicotinate-nucleotide adenylyltransferase
MAGTREKIGLFGGTFDPIHLGHTSMVRAARSGAGLDRTILLVAAAPPHKDSSTGAPEASFEHRLRMAGIATHGDEGLEVSDRESRREAPSYTVDTLKELRNQAGGGAEFHFLIGADWIPRLSTWKDIGEIFTLCQFVVVPRGGFGKADLRSAARGLEEIWVESLEKGWVETAEVDISSTLVRERISDGLPVGSLVHPGVERYIIEHGLYRQKSGIKGSRNS